MNYKYRVYGLDIISEIKIKEFKTISSIDNNSININFGIVPEKFREYRKEGNIIYLTRKEIWFYIKDLAQFYIKDGKYIIVDTCKEYDNNLLKAYLMCSCLGFIMLQRNILAIHGGVLSINNRGIILTGEKGAGKSTLTAALIKKGYKFISDDVASIRFNNNKPYVMPGFPYQKLCEDSIRRMNIENKNIDFFNSNGKVKYLVPINENIIGKEEEVLYIFQLVVGKDENIFIEEIRGSKKIEYIIDNIYRGEYIKNLNGVTPEYFIKCTNIARNIRFFKITRPKDKFTVDKQIELIEDKLLKFDEVVV
ncbi:hypothetical protein [Clostridium saudiense]|uniref:hypothetical protein n=1 Tax=Clostridium saudiense TaxID=1414720 RepID=UPI0018ABD647|nr:hypothetical protein [Clostridium saudiense]